MQRLLSILGVLVYLNVFSQGNLNWPESVGLDYFDNSELITQGNATIALQASNFPFFNVLLSSEITPLAIPSGSIIGVFYDTNDSNMIEEWVCGGFNFWPEDNESFTLASWEDDYSTNGLDGFTSNTEYVWFLRINNNSDDPSGGWTDYIGQNAIMDNSYDLDLCGGQCQQNFVANGLSNLLMVDFTLYSEWSNCMDMSACNYNSQAAGVVDNIVFEDQGCEYPESEWVDCDGVCYDDDDDGVCNINEQVGCMDPLAFNYEDYYTDPATCMYQGCMDPIALNYENSATVQGPCEYPEYQFDWTVEQGYPLNFAVFAIDSIIGLPENDSFCNDVTIGAFYGNNNYLSNQEAIVGGQFYSVTDLDVIQDGLLIEGHYPLFESYISAVLSNNANATFNSNIYSYDQYIDEISSWTNYSDTSSTPYLESIIDAGEYAIPESLLDNMQNELYTGYVGDFLEDVYMSSSSSSGIEPVDNFPNYSDSYGSGFSGYGNGSFYSCQDGDDVGLYQSLLAIYEDDNTTGEKDGFNNDEPMVFIVELNGIEYLAEPSFHVVTELDGSQSLQTVQFEQNGMYAADLIIVGTVAFGCTDENYLEYDSAANILDGSCVTLMIEGCTDVYAANYNPQANTDDDSCYYFACTDDTFLEYYNYDPISYSISSSNYSPDLYSVVDDGSCLTPIVYGCTDVSAFNYSILANVDDSSCIDIVEGCTDSEAFNYNPDANTDYDGALCTPIIDGCLDYLAVNYNPLANTDDSSCYYQPGCTELEALNYEEDADYDDGSCIEIVEGCTIESMFNYDSNANVNDGSCVPFIYGCTIESMWNYNLNANTDDDSCIPFIYGCTDPTAYNYDSSANTDDETCIIFVYGCLDEMACNYDSSANTSDGSCIYAATYYNCTGLCVNDFDGDGVCDELEIPGCTDPSAFNYDLTATDNDGTCIAIIEGCTNSSALNFDSSPNTDDGSCCYIAGCTDPLAVNYNSSACFNDESCISVIEGCTNPSAFNYDSSANTDNGTCIPFIYGCTDNTMFNYNSDANTDFEGLLCVPFISGCTDPDAFNYTINANTDDGSCIAVVEGCTFEEAFNYDDSANTDDGSCIPVIEGCMDSEAANYNPDANTAIIETCYYLIFGCTNANAYNFNIDATVNDGSCIPFIYGCTDQTAYNYNVDANTEDSSCEPVILGCTNPYYFNYNSDANVNDGSCIAFIYGCMDETASNYDSDANFDFGGLLCVDVVEGCIDSEALNYDAEANTDNGTCYYQAGCTDPSAFNYDVNADYDDDSCVDIVEGCLDVTAFNYNVNANTDDGSCVPFIYGCTDPVAFNYNSNANTDFGGLLCIYVIYGCTDASAFNYDSNSNTDDGSCYPFIFGCLDITALNFNDYDSDGASNAPTGDSQIDVNTDFGGIFCEYPIYGCTDPYSINYDSSANVDDGSCIQFVFGCMDEEAVNYNEFANIDFDGIFCVYAIYGCTDSSAFNYDATATDDDGSCEPEVEGCLDDNYLEYDANANTDDDSCATLIVEGCIDDTYLEYDSNANTDDGTCVTLIVEGCIDSTAMNYNPSANTDDNSCIPFIYGCTDPTMWNYSPEANTDDDSCIPFIYGCTDSTAFNFDLNLSANTDDGSCEPVVEGCTDPNATNYLPSANTDDDSCLLAGCINDAPGENPDIFGNYDDNGDGYEASNYNPDANIDNGSCIIIGCTINAWYICPESYNPDATITDWSMCTFVWQGCETANTNILLPDQYPTMLLGDITNDIDDAYYYLGEDRIGCMDKSADNYLITAVVDDESCMYSLGSLIVEKNTDFKIYPQPASTYILIEMLDEESIFNQEMVIYNILGAEVSSFIIKENKIKLNIEDWVDGVYYAKMYLNNNYVTYKFLVE